MVWLEFVLTCLGQFADFCERLQPILVRFALFAIFAYGLWHMFRTVVRTHRHEKNRPRGRESMPDTAESRPDA